MNNQLTGTDASVRKVWAEGMDITTPYIHWTDDQLIAALAGTAPADGETEEWAEYLEDAKRLRSDGFKLSMTRRVLLCVMITGRKKREGIQTGAGDESPGTSGEDG